MFVSAECNSNFMPLSGPSATTSRVASAWRVDARGAGAAAATGGAGVGTGRGATAGAGGITAIGDGSDPGRPIIVISSPGACKTGGASGATGAGGGTFATSA